MLTLLVLDSDLSFDAQRVSSSSNNINTRHDQDTTCLVTSTTHHTFINAHEVEILVARIRICIHRYVLVSLSMARLRVPAAANSAVRGFVASQKAYCIHRSLRMSLNSVSTDIDI